ncbi:hypothetical protein, partial [Modestobacter versicolor]|uniref:hypothetical protein n=1 Tax=Modestobacter versicolor TaxID=429133 RepID=UPI0034DEAFCB
VEVDLEIISAVYEWDELHRENVWAFKKYYLPKAIIQSILALYQDKTTLKDVKGREVDYLRSKGMLNPIYGMCVTDIVKDDHIYDDVEGWGIEETDVKESIQDYNRSKSRFLYYPWGIWVTAYARRNLWSAILAVGNDYIYSDTDSIKMLNYDKHVGYVEQYNADIQEKLRRCMQYYKLDESLLNPKTIKGVEKPLGVWDFEGNYSRFKTVGAKRYLVEENGKLKLTVAGLSKQNGINYMKEVCDNDNTAVFEMF